MTVQVGHEPRCRGPHRPPTLSVGDVIEADEVETDAQVVYIAEAEQLGYLLALGWR